LAHRLLHLLRSGSGTQETTGPASANPLTEGTAEITRRVIRYCLRRRARYGATHCTGSCSLRLSRWPDGQAVLPLP